MKHKGREFNEKANVFIFFHLILTGIIMLVFSGFVAFFLNIDTQAPLRSQIHLGAFESIEVIIIGLIFWLIAVISYLVAIGMMIPFLLVFGFYDEVFHMIENFDFPDSWYK